MEVALTERFHLLGAFIVSSQRTLLGSQPGLSGQRRGARTQAPVETGDDPGHLVGHIGQRRRGRLLQVEEPVPARIVQLVRCAGARNTEYDGHALVTRLAEKLGGEGYYLNAPFLCPNPETAAALHETQGVPGSLEMGRKAEVALLGIGSTAPGILQLCLAGYVPIEELQHLNQAGAVGDVCGINFDIQGRTICADFCDRLVTISKDDLPGIPVRIGIAGGSSKAEPILGALRGGYINSWSRMAIPPAPSSTWHQRTRTYS
ncbi:MAG: hypothetical protein M0C28_43900 [Candidatus Moduliflexus flocculans]|nr:hypothetical protein [Candidatus Moduliflexus flocculans]